MWRHSGQCGEGKAPSSRRVWDPPSRFLTKAVGIFQRRESIWPRRFAGALQNSPESIKSLNKNILLILEILLILYYSGKSQILR